MRGDPIIFPSVAGQTYEEHNVRISAPVLALMLPKELLDAPLPVAQETGGNFIPQVCPIRGHWPSFHDTYRRRDWLKM